MKHRVILDKGVTIAGRHYPHGAVVDSEFLTHDLPMGAGNTAKAQHLELKVQADKEYAAATKAGNQLEPIAAEKAAVKPAEKEG